MKSYSELFHDDEMVLLAFDSECPSPKRIREIGISLHPQEGREFILTRVDIVRYFGNEVCGRWILD